MFAVGVSEAGIDGIAADARQPCLSRGIALLTCHGVFSRKRLARYVSDQEYREMVSEIPSGCPGSAVGGIEVNQETCARSRVPFETQIQGWSDPIAL